MKICKFLYHDWEYTTVLLWENDMDELYICRTCRLQEKDILYVYEISKARRVLHQIYRFVMDLKYRFDFKYRSIPF